MNMSIAVNYRETITRQMENFSPELIQEVIDFVEFLKIKRVKKSGVDTDSLFMQQGVLDKIWNNKSEELYEL